MRHLRMIDLVMAVAIVACVARFTHNLETAMDLQSADETIYLNKGRNLLSGGLTEPAYGPLYQLWYFALSRMAGDPIDLYYLNYRALLAGLTLAAYFLLRRLKVAPLAALVIAVYVLNARPPYVWPYPGHFATVCILAFTALALCLRRTARLVVMALGLQLAGYTRPELFLSFVLFSLAAAAYLAYSLWRQGGRKWRESAPVAASGLSVALLLVVCFGNPLGGSGDHHRSFVAFGQHYAVNRVAATGEDLNPWTNWETILARDFGSAASTSACLRENPRAFLAHLGTNACEVFDRMYGLSRLNASHAKLTKLLVVLAFLVVFGLVLWRGGGDNRRRQERNIPWPLTLLLACLLAAILPSAILVHPRSHYLLPFWSLGLVMAIAAASRRFRELRGGPLGSRFRALRWNLRRPISLPDPVRRFAAPVAVVVVALGVTAPRERGLKQNRLFETRLPMANTARRLRQLGIDEEVAILRMEIGLEWYIADNYRGIEPWDKDEPFLDFLGSRQIRLIVDEYHIHHDSRMRDDPQFAAVMDRPADFGFRSIPIPGTDRRLLVSEDLCDDCEQFEKARLSERPIKASLSSPSPSKLNGARAINSRGRFPSPHPLPGTTRRRCRAAPDRGLDGRRQIRAEAHIGRGRESSRVK